MNSVSSFPFTRLITGLIFIGLSSLYVGCSSAPRASFSPRVVEDQTVDGRVTRIRFVFPLKKYRRISRGFRGRHKGLDISARKNTPIYAAESGWVTYRGRGFRGYGNLVIIEHSKSWASFYAHLNAFNVGEGKWVNKGEIIGYVGRTGRATGNHLHFEIRYTRTPVDPMDYLNMKWADDGSSGQEDHVHAF